MKLFLSCVAVFACLSFLSGCANDSSGDRGPARANRPVPPGDLDITQYDQSDRDTRLLTQNEAELSLQVYTDLGRMSYVGEKMKPSNSGSGDGVDVKDPQKPIQENSPVLQPIVKYNRYFDTESFVQNLLQSMKSQQVCNTTVVGTVNGGRVTTNGAQCPIHSDFLASVNISNNEADKMMTAEVSATNHFKINDLSQHDFSPQEIIAGNESLQSNMMLKFPKQGEMNFAMSGNMKHQGNYVSRRHGRFKVSMEGVAAIETLGSSSQSGTLVAVAGRYIVEFESGLKTVLLIKMDPSNPNDQETCTLNKVLLSKLECAVIIDKLNARPTIDSNGAAPVVGDGSSPTPIPIGKK